MVKAFFRSVETQAYFIPDADFRIENFSLPEMKLPYKELRDAQFGANFSQLQKPVFLSSYHWLKNAESGSDRKVFIFRQFMRPMIFWDDKSVFTKITVSAPALDLKTYRFSEGEVKGFYTKGAGARPLDQCGGEIKSGDLTIVNIEYEKVEARLTAELECRSLLADSVPEKVIFSGTHVFNKIIFSELTPWLGVQGASVREESYP